MPAPKRPRLRHIPVRLRVSVDPEKWSEHFASVDHAALPDAVRRYVVGLVQDSDAAHAGAIVSSRRDQDQR